MRQIVADANALMMPFQKSLNIDSELARLVGSYEIVVPRPIVGELEKLSARNKIAKMALSLAGTKKIVETEAVGDASVIEAAEKSDGFILTNDRALIQTARLRKIPVIRLLGGSHLGFDEGLEPVNY